MKERISELMLNSTARGRARGNGFDSVKSNDFLFSLTSEKTIQDFVPLRYKRSVTKQHRLKSLLAAHLSTFSHMEQKTCLWVSKAPKLM